MPSLCQNSQLPLLFQERKFRGPSSIVRGVNIATVAVDAFSNPGFDF